MSKHLNKLHEEITVNEAYFDPDGNIPPSVHNELVKRQQWARGENLPQSVVLINEEISDE